MYTLRRFIVMTLDPVHIGTGGYRLGRVDLSIVREPGTSLPKIPGTSLSGMVRSYAAIRYEKLRCAGQGQGESEEKRHCGQPTCPICYTFGTARGEAEGGNAGTVNVFDARLLLFPVYSMAGPVWVTSPSVLADFGISEQEVNNAKARWTVSSQRFLNLGWLMVEKDGDDWQPPGELSNRVPDPVKSCIVLVSDKLFPQIVNSNLEVRTSVSIDPYTGAAREGALFTYEALPRSTFLWFDLVEDDYQRDPGTNQSRFPVTERKCKTERRTDANGNENISYKDNGGEELGEKWERPLDVVKAGLALSEYLGVGGMNTRGFGRMKIISGWEVKNG